MGIDTSIFALFLEGGFMPALKGATVQPNRATVEGSSPFAELIGLLEAADDGAGGEEAIELLESILQGIVQPRKEPQSPTEGAATKEVEAKSGGNSKAAFVVPPSTLVKEAAVAEEVVATVKAALGSGAEGTEAKQTIVREQAGVEKPQQGSREQGTRVDKPYPPMAEDEGVEPYHRAEAKEGTSPDRDVLQPAVVKEVAGPARPEGEGFDKTPKSSDEADRRAVKEIDNTIPKESVPSKTDRDASTTGRWDRPQEGDSMHRHTTIALTTPRGEHQHSFELTIEGLGHIEDSPVVSKEQITEEVLNRLSGYITKLSIKGGRAEARLTLNPPELGRLKVEIEVNNSKVETRIVVEHQMVKDVLNAEVARLRDMFLQQGLTLDKYTVETATGWATHRETGRDSLWEERQQRQPTLYEGTTEADSVSQSVGHPVRSPMSDNSGNISLFA